LTAELLAAPAFATGIVSVQQSAISDQPVTCGAARSASGLGRAARELILFSLKADS